MEDCKERLEREIESVKKSWSQEVTELTRDKQQLKERDRRVRELQAETEAIVAASHSSSPTPSLSRLSTTGSDSFSREPWPEDMYTGSTLMHTTSLYETQGRLGSTASLMETLQAQLK